MEPTPIPTMTSREASLHVAHAGMEARVAAAQTGGDPVQVSALMRAGASLPPVTSEHIAVVGGLGLHGIVLAVTIATAELARAAADEKVSAELTLARLAACFHAPHQACEVLSAGLPAFNAWVLQLVGHWTQKDVTDFADFLALQKARSPSLTDSTGDPEGKSVPRP